jgi:DNA polymerase-3 subunit delta
MESQTFLERLGSHKVQPVYAVYGDEDFLKRRVLAALRDLVLGPASEEFGLSTHAGDRATFAAVHDELITLPFLSPRRLVVVENADPFVTEHRSSLEKYVEAPASSSGVLVLDVRSWPSTTRLAKLVGNMGAISCKAPSAPKLVEWCIAWASSSQQKELTAPAARLLVDLVGPEMGLLDQEIAKLASYVGKAARIDAGDVDRLVGASREEDTWKVFDAIGTGNVSAALGIVQRLLERGDEPIRILGAFSYQLRRLAQAARLNQLGRPLASALAEAGIPAFVIQSAEQQMKHLGRRRLDRLYDWLLEVDQGLKGGSELSQATLLERLVVRLARKNTA